MIHSPQSSPRQRIARSYNWANGRIQGAKTMMSPDGKTAGNHFVVYNPQRQQQLITLAEKLRVVCELIQSEMKAEFNEQMEAVMASESEKII